MLLFLGYSVMSKTGGSRGPGEIVVTQGQIENLAATFAKTWQRPPSNEELLGLIRDRVREEVYCREALALGLDRDDTIIRRRLRQKMEFISDDIAAQADPTDAELNAYMQSHPDRFRDEQRFTFLQIYFNPDKHGRNLARDTAKLLAQLNQSGDKADPDLLGDSFPLQTRFAVVPASEVAKQFGEKFAANLGELLPGKWQGPVDSGYGVHLVYVSDRTEARLPVLEEVHDVVRREWENEQRLEANETFFQDMLNRYTVTIESPQIADNNVNLQSGTITGAGYMMRDARK